MSMTIESIEPAFWDIKEQIENGGVMMDNLEARIVELEKKYKRMIIALDAAANLTRRLTEEINGLKNLIGV